MKPLETSFTIVRDPELSAQIIRNAGSWMQSRGMDVNDWWNPSIVDTGFLGKYAKPDEFYVVMVDGKPAATAIIQSEQNAQDWSSVDGEMKPLAMYVHWLAVERQFSGKGYAEILLEHAEKLAEESSIATMRLDTNADEPRLRKLYEDNGYMVVKYLNKNNHKTALYEKQLK